MTATGVGTGPTAIRKVRFPWYDFEFLRQDHQLAWRNLRERLVAQGVSSMPADPAAERDLDAILRCPALLLSQTCGYDIAVARPVELRPVLTPIYAAPCCGVGTYRSFIVVARDSHFSHLRDLSGARFVANDDRSWSGLHCMREIGARWCCAIFSGSHVQSLETVARGEADWAAIDSIVWALLRDHDRTFVDRFRVVAVTREVPAPPLVTSLQTGAAVLAHVRHALHAMATDPALQPSLRRLRISGFVERPRADYEFMDLDRES